MPPLSNLQQADPDCVRILVTGFGPFGKFKDVNPSYLAACMLHDELLDIDESLHPPPPPITDPQGDQMMDHPVRPRQIHVSTAQIPTVYEAVTTIIPGLHARPPVVPSHEDLVHLPPPEDGYDLIVHVGVAGRGPLRMERMAHKSGYRMKDALGKLAPIIEKVVREKEATPDLDIPAIHANPPGIGNSDMNDEFFPANSPEPVPEDTTPLRGFSKGYEAYSEEIYVTDIDVESLNRHIKQVYPETYTSMDAGHYVCDFTYYCSLAEAKKTAKGRSTRVFFVHCPPVDQPHTSEEVADALRRSIIWISSTCPA